MGMGFAGAHIITIDESVVKEKCPKELAAFKKLTEEHGQHYCYLAIDGQSDMLTDEVCEIVNIAHNKLIDAFKKKTKLEICYFYHDIENDGDRYDDVEEAWEVHNAYQITKAAKRFEKHIQHANFVMWG
jgi:hypothetical protein